MVLPVSQTIPSANRVIMPSLRDLDMDALAVIAQHRNIADLRVQNVGLLFPVVQSSRVSSTL